MHFDRWPFPDSEGKTESMADCAARHVAQTAPQEMEQVRLEELIAMIRRDLDIPIPDRVDSGC